MSGNISDAVKFGKLAVFQKIILRNIPFIIPEKGSLGDFLFIKKRCRFFQNLAKKSPTRTRKTIFALL